MIGSPNTPSDYSHSERHTGKKATHIKLAFSECWFVALWVVSTEKRVILRGVTGPSIGIVAFPPSVLSSRPSVLYHSKTTRSRSSTSPSKNKLTTHHSQLNPKSNRVDNIILFASKVKSTSVCVIRENCHPPSSLSTSNNGQQ